MLSSIGASKTDSCEVIDDFDEINKLGQGFTLADPLKKLMLGMAPSLGRHL